MTRPGNAAVNALRHLRTIIACAALVLGAGAARGETTYKAVEHEAMRALAAGQFQRALQSWARAAELSRAAGDAAARYRSTFGKGAAYLALGRYPQAIEALQSAVELGEAQGDPRWVTSAKASLGNAYVLAGRSAEGRETLRSAIESARTLGVREIAVTATANLATSLASTGQLDEAIDLYRSIIDDATHGADALLAARTRVNLARALAEGGRRDDALALLERAGRELSALPASHAQAYALISVGRIYGEDPRAVEAFRAAAESARTIDDQRALSYAQGYQGALYEAAGRFDNALELTQRALRAAAQVDAPELDYRWQWQRGRILKARGDIDDAIVAYRLDVESLQSIRQELVAGYGTSRSSFRDQVGPVFLQFADLMLGRTAAMSDAAAAEASLREVRETVELLKGAELADYFQDDCVARLKTRTAGIDQLASNTAALYPIMLPDRVELLVSLPDGIRQFTSYVSAEEFTARVRELRIGLERRITRQYLPPSRLLYEWLLGPLEEELDRQQIDTLVFVPDGALRTIPLSALHDGSDFVVRKFAVATTPGLTLTDPQPIARGNVKLLVNGLTEAVQGFPPLPNIAEELESIEAMYPGTVLRDDEFRLEAVQQQITDRAYSIVHIASHGQFESDVRESFLLTYDDKLNMDELERLVGATGLREQPVELLTLSACQTAAGDDRAALGLAGIAIKAGARSALATLWYINDRSSARLIQEFYRQLLDPKVTKAQALRRAQLVLLEDRRYRHPSYWSPFLIIGNWL